MTAVTDANLLSKAFDWIKARASRDNELAAMSRMDLHYLAADLGITEADLRDVAPRITDHSELMDRMMRARGLDPSAVRRSFAALVHDMELTCTRCREARVCRRELDAGTAEMYCHDFCANAEAMDEMRQAGA